MAQLILTEEEKKLELNQYPDDLLLKTLKYMMLKFKKLELVPGCTAASYHLINLLNESGGKSVNIELPKMTCNGKPIGDFRIIVRRGK